MSRTERREPRKRYGGPESTIWQRFVLLVRPPPPSRLSECASSHGRLSEETCQEAGGRQERRSKSPSGLTTRISSVQDVGSTGDNATIKLIDDPNWILVVVSYYYVILNMTVLLLRDTNGIHSRTQQVWRGATYTQAIALLTNLGLILGALEEPAPIKFSRSIRAPGLLRPALLALCRDVEEGRRGLRRRDARWSR